MLQRQTAILQPIAAGISAEPPLAQGFNATLLAWRRASAAAVLSFLDDITGLTPAGPVGSAGGNLIEGRSPATADSGTFGCDEFPGFRWSYRA